MSNHLVDFPINLGPVSITLLVSSHVAVQFSGMSHFHFPFYVSTRNMFRNETVLLVLNM